MSTGAEDPVVAAGSLVETGSLVAADPVVEAEPVDGGSLDVAVPVEAVVPGAADPQAKAKAVTRTTSSGSTRSAIAVPFTRQPSRLLIQPPVGAGHDSTPVLQHISGYAQRA